jgi:aminoglycoside phosphotransferase family enzyme
VAAAETHIPADQREVIAFLDSPRTYGVATVERCETHGALVFLAGGRAYKLKRAVQFPYMDFSTPGRRHAFSLAELTVNRRTAPELYLEVRSIVRDAGGG